MGEEKDELLARIENLEREVIWLRKRKDAALEDFKSLSLRFSQTIHLIDEHLKDYGEHCRETRESIDSIMDKVFPDHCTYLGDIQRALEPNSSPSKPKG